MLRGQTQSKAMSLRKIVSFRVGVTELPRDMDLCTLLFIWPSPFPTEPSQYLCSVQTISRLLSTSAKRCRSRHTSFKHTLLSRASLSVADAWHS